MSCAFIAGPLPPAPPLELDPLPPLADISPDVYLDPLPAFEGLPDVPGDLPEPVEPDALAPVRVEAMGEAGYAQSETNDVVAGIMASTGVLATSSQAAALRAVEMLSQYAQNLSSPLVAPAIPGTTVALPGLGDAPVADDLTAHFPDAPAAPDDIAAPLLDVAAPPDYAVAEIHLMDIPLPDPMEALLPAEPALDAIGTAVEPDFVLPAVPTLLELALPASPTLTLPLLDTPNLSKPDAPDITFAYADVEYGSTLLSAMNAKIAQLAGDMNQTGIGQAVEQGIWDRAADREALLTHRATGEAVRLMRSRGFAMPEPTMVRIVQQALQGGLHRAATLEREIGIEQARLRQQNFRFALETAISLESRMIDKHNQAQARALEAAKATVLAEIAIFNAKISLYQADVAAFAMKASTFRSRLEAALASIEIYKSQLEGQRLVGEINSQQVAIYKSQIDGVRAIADLFKSRVEAAKQQIANTKSTVDQFKSRIAAYEAQVTAKMSDYEAYAARVKGQTAKTALFAEQVKAYRSQVSAYDALTRAKIGAQTLRFKQANEFPLDLYRARIDAYKAGVGASMEQLRSVSQVFAARIKAFAAQENAKAENVDAQLKVATANAEAQIAQANTLLQAGRSNLSFAESAAQTAQNNLRTAGQLSGQLAASAVAAQSVNASISESGSFGVSNSASGSSSNSTNVSATTSIGQSSSVNEAHSATQGMSVNNSRTNSEGRSYNRGQSHTFSNNRSVSNSVQISVRNSTTNDVRINNNVTASESCTDRTTINE